MMHTSLKSTYQSEEQADVLGGIPNILVNQVARLCHQNWQSCLGCDSLSYQGFPRAWGTVQKKTLQKT